MKIGILTSTATRHRYFANRLAEVCDVVAVGFEETGYDPSTSLAEDLSPGDAKIVAGHFAQRARQEELFFGSNAEVISPDESCAVRSISCSQLNSAATLSFLDESGADTVAVFGTNLIKPALLNRYPNRMVNMHLGLSPYYRGTATNFYPLLNEEPEYVGATIHLLDAGIDSGPILRHARPAIVADDQPHTIGCKAIIAGIEAMIAVLDDLEHDRLTPVPQWKVPNPRLYLRKDYHPRQVVELYEKLDAGLIPNYVERAAQAAARVRVVE